MTDKIKSEDFIKAFGSGSGSKEPEHHIILDITDNEDAKKHFKGKCPYTDKKCEDWRCQDCEVEATERNYMKEIWGNKMTDTP